MAAACKDVPCCSLDRTSTKRESFTVWMKSLIMQGKGCTVFNEDGEVVYRMDNYDTRRSRKVYLMDLQGRVLFTIIKRKLRFFGRWEGYKSEKYSASGSHNKRTWFRVRKDCSILKKSWHCDVTTFCGKTQRSCYSIEGFTDKLEFNIKNSIGSVLAEVRRKQTTSGVCLGEDVLALVIEPQVDHSLIVALVAVYGSICHRM
ncbi:hypothetical protein CDL15_Pgr017904 [Punica granatum]|uniref:Protein LURP-one-related 11-like n=1 Tax=Punica granatum TaxID=22663 RepID=A0A218WIG5_PUNGR|nr:hypothetical protein CDL15_Pgr017904 [Punica granatum]